MTSASQDHSPPTRSFRSALLPPSIKGRGAGGIRSALVLLLLASLACSALPLGVGPTRVPDPAEPAPAYTGQFDCEGVENGLRAYAGRITVQTGGQVTFKDYDGAVQTGAWTYDVSGKTFTFSGSTALASGIYKETDDTLIVVLAPNAAVVHANSGMKCQRAVPGQTGPP
jgi:hypothetical protein